MDVFMDLTMRIIDRFLIKLRFKELKQPITKCNKVSMIHIDSIVFLILILQSIHCVTHYHSTIHGQLARFSKQ